MKLIVLTILLSALIAVVYSNENMKDFKAGISSLLQFRVEQMPSDRKEAALKILTKSMVEIENCEKEYKTFDEEAVGKFFECASSKYADCNKKLNNL